MVFGTKIKEAPSYQTVFKSNLLNAKYATHFENSEFENFRKYLDFMKFGENLYLKFSLPHRDVRLLNNVYWIALFKPTSLSICFYLDPPRIVRKHEKTLEIF